MKKSRNVKSVKETKSALLLSSTVLEDLEQTILPGAESANNIYQENLVISSSYGPRHKKTCLWGVRQSKTQTSLLSYRDKLEN